MKAVHQTSLLNSKGELIVASATDVDIDEKKSLSEMLQQLESVTQNNNLEILTALIDKKSKLNDQESELVDSLLAFYRQLTTKKMRFVRLLRQPCSDESGDQYLIVRFDPNID